MGNIRTAILLTAACMLLAGCSTFDSLLKGHSEPTGKPEEKAAVDPVSPDGLNIDMDVFSVLAERPVVPFTPARGSKEPIFVEHPIPPSGTMVIDRRATVLLNKPTGWYVARFENEKGKPYEVSRLLLPCEMTEELSAMNAENPNAILRLTGETFVYRGQPYLLPLSASIDTPQHPMPSPKGPEQAMAPKEDEVAAVTGTSGESSAEDIQESLRKQYGGDTDPVISPIRRKEGGHSPVPSEAPALGREIAPSRSTLVVDRLVVVTQESDSKWWVIRFEADNTLMESPIRILPCEPLERIENIVKNSPKNYLRFRISGNVYSYKGKYYLLLRKLLVEREMGQF